MTRSTFGGGAHLSDECVCVGGGGGFKYLSKTAQRTVHLKISLYILVHVPNFGGLSGSEDRVGVTTVST